MLIDLQREAGALVRGYLLLGIDAKALSSDPSGDKAARNFLDFLPEMAALYDYRIRVGAIIADSAAALPGPKPEPRVSLAVAAIATEQEKVLLSAIAVASDPQVDARWRADRVRVLQESVRRLHRADGAQAGPAGRRHGADRGAGRNRSGRLPCF